VSVLVVGEGAVAGAGAGDVGVGINCTDLHRAFRAQSCRLCNPEVGPALLFRSHAVRRRQTVHTALF